jgi:hypothetical protein
MLLVAVDLLNVSILVHSRNDSVHVKATPPAKRQKRSIMTKAKRTVSQQATMSIDSYFFKGD